MFVTCLYGVLDPPTGKLTFANAGHNVPYRRSEEGITELKACGMPLGLMPGMTYPEREVVLEPGDSVVFLSDGLAEAHNADRDMFGNPRITKLICAHSGGTDVISHLLEELGKFTGPGWEQEDDITLLALQRMPHAGADDSEGGSWSPLDDRVLADFEIPSAPGNEREAMARVESAVQGLDLDEGRLEKLKTAVAETTMNAIEHGNENRPEVPVHIRVVASDTALRVRITDQGGEKPIMEAVAPDLDAKLAGLQTPRGWGLFLIKSMVDEMHVASDDHSHTIELILHLKGNDHAGQTA